MNTQELIACLQMADRIMAKYDAFESIDPTETSRTTLAIGLTALSDDEVQQIAPILNSQSGWDGAGRLRGRFYGRYNARAHEVHTALNRYPGVEQDVSFSDPYALRIMIARLRGDKVDVQPTRRRKRGLLRRR